MFHRISIILRNIISEWKDIKPNEEKKIFLRLHFSYAQFPRLTAEMGFFFYFKNKLFLVGPIMLSVTNLTVA